MSDLLGLGDLGTPSERVQLYYNEATEKHTHQWPHLEKCTRARHAFEHLKQKGLLERVEICQGRKATDAELNTVHTMVHISEVMRMSDAARTDPANGQLRDPGSPGGVYYSPEADSAARFAAGCVVDAAKSVMREPLEHELRPPPAFALVRPPGHHAGANDEDGRRAEGFCFYNNVAVAAGVIRASQLASKIAILDWDLHHGNGTQEIFYDDERVLYISLHRFGERCYPGTGAHGETGEEAGAGHTVNVPWTEDGVNDADYLAAFKLLVCPILAAYGPELLLLSAGFGAADGDAQGKMRVTPAGFASLTAMAMDAVTCPAAVALEGGDNATVTAECCEAVLRVLCGDAPPRVAPQSLSPRTESVIRKALDAHRPFWPKALRFKRGFLDAFFLEAQNVGPAPRGSKRKSVAPVFADEESPLAKRKGVLPPPKARGSSARSEKKKAAAKRQAERQAAMAQAVAQVATLEKSLKTARRKQREAEEVKCEAGRRVWAQHGDDDDALWFRATVIGVRRSEIGQWVDVEYDGGEREMRKDIKRVKALDDTPSDSESESSEEEDGDELGSPAGGGLASILVAARNSR